MQAIHKIRWSLQFWIKLKLEIISNVIKSKLSSRPIVGKGDIRRGATGIFRGFLVRRG